MKVGIVGFAGSGKSTVFQWLTGVKPDPSKSQLGQIGIAKIPDERLDWLSAQFQAEEDDADDPRVPRHAGPAAERAARQPAPARHPARGRRPARRAERLQRAETWPMSCAASAKSCCSPTWRSSPTASSELEDQLRKPRPAKQKRSRSAGTGPAAAHRRGLRGRTSRRPRSDCTRTRRRRSAAFSC